MFFRDKKQVLTVDRPDHKVGQKRNFFVFDNSLNQEAKVPMTCVWVSRASAIYQEQDMAIPRELLARIEQEIAGQRYLIAGGILAPGRPMGLNWDERVTVLLLDSVRGRPADAQKMPLAGYYTNVNERLKLYEADSNEAKLIHVFVDLRWMNEEDIAGTVAHEMRHLRNWSEAKNNVGLAISGLFAIATVLTLYLGLSAVYTRGFST